MSALDWEESDCTGTCFFLAGRGTQSDYTFRCLYYRHLHLIKSIPPIWFLLDWKDGVCFVYICCVLIMDSVTWVDGSVLYSLSLNQVEIEGVKFKLLIKVVWKTRVTNSESVDCVGLNCKVSFNAYTNRYIKGFFRSAQIYALMVWQHTGDIRGSIVERSSCKLYKCANTVWISSL